MARQKGSPTGRCQGCNHPERVRIEGFLAAGASIKGAAWKFAINSPRQPGLWLSCDKRELSKPRAKRSVAMITVRRSLPSRGRKTCSWTATLFFRSQLSYGLSGNAAIAAENAAIAFPAGRSGTDYSFGGSSRGSKTPITTTVHQFFPTGANRMARWTSLDRPFYKREKPPNDSRHGPHYSVFSGLSDRR